MFSQHTRPIAAFLLALSLVLTLLCLLSMTWNKTNTVQAQPINALHSFVSLANDPTNVATVTVGSNPFGVGVNPTTNRIYVANNLSHTVSVIDGASNTTVATVTVGRSPWGVGVNPSTNRIYVGNFLSHTVSVIDGVNNNIVATIMVGSFPQGVGINPVTNRIYVASYYDSTISVIDGMNNTVVATATVGTYPYCVDVNPITNRIYVANWGSNNVSVIDGTNNTTIATVTLGIQPMGVSVNPTINRIYATNFDFGGVSVIDGANNTAVATVTAGLNPSGIGVNPTTNRIYVANNGSNTVSVIQDAILLTVHLDGAGGGIINSIPPSLNCGITCSALLDANSAVTLTATLLVTSSFAGWSGDVIATTNPVTFTMDTNKTITATFLLQTFIITPTAGANGTITPSKPQAVNYGASRTFTIIPNNDYHITDVGVDGISQGPLASYTFNNVTANHTISAAFAINIYTLDVGIVAANIGDSVLFDPPSLTHPAGTVVTLTAVPGQASRFVSWIGDVMTTINPLVMTMDSNKTVTAVFVTYRIYLPLVRK